MKDFNTHGLAIEVLVGRGQADWTHVSGQGHWRLQLEQSHIIDNAVGVVIGVDSGLDHLPDNARVPGGSVDLEQANGDLIPVTVDAVSRSQDIAIVDQRTTAEETGIVTTLDQLSGPRILVGAHLLATNDTVNIGGSTD